MFEDRSIAEICEYWKSDRKKGLTEEEAVQRLQKNGRNEMKAAHKKTWIETFLEQLNDPLIYVLIAAAFISILLGESNDAIIIAVVVFVNAVVGMIQEGKAQKALDSLKKLTSPHAVVIRGGIKRDIPAAELVTGDLISLEAGCQVPADVRLTSTANLKIEESALTGESLPIEKDFRFQAEKTLPLGDRKNMAYMSTIVTYGRGEGIVTAVGMDTELGQIAAMISESKEELTPLQKRLGELGKVLSLLSVGLCAALFVIALVQKRDILEMLLTAISLAVAAVPEGLPAVVTICLALSVTRMVKVNTIIRRLPSVETLGAVSIVCSDKTGTLTQNRMTVERCFLNGREYNIKEIQPKEQQEFLYGMTLCNDAAAGKNNRMGDPTELALLDLALQYNIQKENLDQQFPRSDEIAFDSDRKMMSTCHKKNGRLVMYTKGAPDEVLKRCSKILQYGQVVELTEFHCRQILKGVEALSASALRTLAVAMKEERKEDTNTIGIGTIEKNRMEHNGSFLSSNRIKSELEAASYREKNGERNREKNRYQEKFEFSEDNLIFLGIAAMKDPARPEAAQAVEVFKGAGVSTVMITGDHVDTAFAIGKQLGIVNSLGECMTGTQIEQETEKGFLRRLDTARVFARVTPAQKVQIVKGFQEKGQIVAMTGDGVNDAPSLKAADIGIAMGKNGTDVAKQASDMILTDDNFATIEKAIEEGRGVYENIRKSVIFLLSSNLGEIMTMFLAVICGLASPLKSSHILWINLITDSLPALALGVDCNDGRSLMHNSPRKPEESLFARGGLACTCFYGFLIACISLTAFLMLPLSILRQQGLSVSLEQLSLILSNEAVLAKAQTYAFTVLGMSQLYHAIGMRDVQTSFFRMNHLSNKLMIAAFVIGFALQWAVTEVPFLIQAFGTSHLEGGEWLQLSLLAAFPLLAHECIVFFGRKRKD